MKKRLFSILLAAIMVFSLLPVSAFAATTYAITNGTPESAKETNHGYIAIDKATAAKDEIVTITVKPNEGYQLKSLTVTPAVPTEYNVTFDLNGITGTAPEAQKIKDGEKVTKPADPTADGYTFGGWYKEATCTNAWDFANDTVTANTTLYAKWKPEDEGSYTLKAQGNWFSAFSETTTDKTKITDIIFCKELPQDVSAEKPVNLTNDSENGKVKGYIVANGDNYKIYIVGDYIFGNSVCYNMFSGFSNLKTLDFGNFDTSKVTIMFNMFSGCSALKSLDLSSFDTSETSNMQSMFTGCSKLESITFGTKFNTSKVTSMVSMFNGCSALKSLDLSSFDTSAVNQGMSSMFQDCSTLTSLNLGSFDTSNVTGMGFMFSGCSALGSLNLSSFDTSAVTKMGGMFTGCSSLESITFGTNFNTSKVTEMNAMFNGCSALKSLELSSFDTSAVTNMDAMFKNCAALESLDLSKFYTSAVTKMSNMFNGCSTLERLDISNFTVGNETTVDDMFKDCSKLTSVKISPENEKIAGALGKDWTYNGETKAYEKAVAKTYTVTFDLNGITGTAPASEPIKSPSPKLLKTSAPETITPAKQANGTYQFTMPAANVTVTAEFEAAAPAPDNETAKILAALSGDEEQGSIEGVLEVKDDESTGFRTVKLLKDVNLSAANVTVAKGVFLDLNHFDLTTTGTVTNNGTIILHQENAGVIDYLLYNVPGNYGTSEELKLPNDAAPDYVIPANTFMTAKVGTTPAAYQELGFASGDDMLVWNKDVPAGMQLKVVYGLTLGGDILSAKTAGIKDTNVTAVNFALNDNISIGSNTKTDGAATLTVKSLYDEDGDHAFDTIATFAANGKTIILNKTGKLVISSDATGFDESVLVSGVPGVSIVKTEDKAAKTVTYSIAVLPPALAGKTDKTITITAVAGLEYRIDNGETWVSDGGQGDGDNTNGTITFTGLEQNTAYRIIARVKATGESSTASVITTKSTEQSTAAADPVDVIGDEIKSGGEKVEVKDENGETVASEDLAAVAEAINEVLDNEKVKIFSETKIEEATEDSNDAIVAALKKQAPDDTAKDKVDENKTDISKYLNVTLVSADVDTTENVVVTSMVFDVTPMATITVTGTGGTSVTLTTEITNDEIDKNVTFLLPVDASIKAETAAVYHEGEFLRNFEITTDVSGNRYIEVTTDSFSEFGYITLDRTTAGAVINTTPETLYASFSDAVAKVANDQTITLLKNASGTVTVSRAVRFTVEVDGNTTNTAEITAGSGYTVSKSGNTYTVSAYSGGGGGGGSSSYAVELPANTKNGKVEVSPKNASAGQTVTLTVTPDKGFTLETLTVLDKNGKEVEVKNLGNGRYSFKMPSGKVSISATFMEDNSMLNFFVDVKADDYYYDAVLWAAENGITQGTDAVHFSPEIGVTRGQVVTFLWRAAGSPVVDYWMRMDDVKSGEYYAEAVRWALSEGITKGTSETTFSPDMVCTRGQIVTFLARFAGVEDADTASAFTDVKTTDYFAAAVKWAKDNKVTEGTSATTFSPNDDCTRAQVVTFLYRWMVK